MSMDGGRYSDMEGNKLPDASGQTGKEAEIMTEAEIEAAFAKFMPRTLGAKLASALCRPPVPVAVKDDEAVKRCPEVLFGPLKPFKIQYDTTAGGIRIVRADMGAFTAVFTCNTRLGHCTAQFYGKAAFSPDIQYVDGRLCLGYPPMAIPPGCEDDFEDAGCEARDFASSYGGTVAAIISAVESVKELKEPAPAP